MLDPQLSPWLAKPIWSFLPPALVQHWPFVFLIVYGTDLALLLLIGRVPLAYNFRYLWVRKRDTALPMLVAGRSLPVLNERHGLPSREV